LALAKSRHLKDFFDLADATLPVASSSGLWNLGVWRKFSRRVMAARAALAGSLLSLLRWWLDRGAKEPPDAMDKLFHQMVWSGVQ